MNLKQVLFSTVAVAGIARSARRCLRPRTRSRSRAPLRSPRRSRSTPTTSAAWSTAPNGAGSRRLGDRRDHRPADPLHPQRRHRRPGPLCHPRSADRQLPGLGARLWPGRLAEDARQARPAAQPHRGARAERGRGGALLSGDLLVRDDEASAGEGLRRLDRHSEEHHARHLASAHEQRRLRRLPSARPGSDAHHPGAVRQVQLGRRSLDAPHPGRPVGRDDDQPHRRPARRRAVQVFRRLDRPRRQGRTAEEQAGAARGPRAQSRRHHLGLVDARQVSARPDLVGPAQAHGQCRRSALRRAGIFDRQDADPRSEDPQGVVLQDAGCRSEHAGLARTGPCRRDQADDAVGLLGRRDPLGHQGEPAQRHVRRQGPRLARRERPRHRQSGLVQEGLGASVGEGVPDRPLAASGGDARSQDQGVQVHRHLLRHPPSAVRLRRRQHAVDVGHRARWRAGSTPRCSTRPADAEKAVGWFPFVLDTNGNGKLDEFADRQAARRARTPASIRAPGLTR